MSGAKRTKPAKELACSNARCNIIKDRKLKLDDNISHFQKIIVALTETDRIMKKIDKMDIIRGYTD